MGTVAQRRLAERKAAKARERKVAATNAELVAKVLNRRSSMKGIRTAEGYVQTQLDCQAGMCLPVGNRVETLKAAASKLVFSNSDMVILKGNPKRVKSGEQQASPATGLVPILNIDLVATSSRRDRDGDVLHPEGAIVDPMMPLLWQHNPVQPIGKMNKLLSQDASKITMNVGVADTSLGRDAAYLAEFGALRFSHGFRPLKYAVLQGATEDDPGFEVFSYEMLEISLVSVPANPDAIVIALQKGKLESGEAKALATKMFGSRKQVFKGATLTTTTKQPVVEDTAGTAVEAGKNDDTTPETSKMDELAKAIKEIAATVKHSGKAGHCFMKATADSTDDAAKADVFWNGNADDIGDNAKDADGNPYTNPDEIKALFKAIDGVNTVTVATGVQPEWGTGWTCAYPDADAGPWGEDKADDDTVATADEDTTPKDDDAEDKAEGDDPEAKGKNGKSKNTPVTTKGVGCGCKTGKGHTVVKSVGKKKPGITNKAKPVTVKGVLATGSAEHIAAEVEKTAGSFLSANGIEIDPWTNVRVVSVYPDHVVIGVGVWEHYYSDVEQASAQYFEVPYTVGSDGLPVLGTPVQPVNIVITFVKPGTPVKPTGDAGAAGTTPTADPASGTQSGAGNDAGGNPPVTTDATTPEPKEGDGEEKGKQSHTVSGKNSTGAKVKSKSIGLNVKGMSKKAVGVLKEADENLDEALKGEMKVPTKTLVKRAKELVKELIDGEDKAGMDDDAANPLDPDNGKADDDTVSKTDDDAVPKELDDDTAKAWSGPTKNALSLLVETAYGHGVKAENVVLLAAGQLQESLTADIKSRNIGSLLDGLLGPKK